MVNDLIRPPLTIPDYPDLPIIAQRQAILSAIRDNPVVIIAGETGSGKTTQLPKLCLEAGQGLRGQIGHTQPRRVAARTIAARIATEMECHLGEQVGYKIRFSDRTSKNTYIKVMTDGILLQESQTDPLLRHYDCIIIDEAHERSLNIDFLLGNLKLLLKKRRDLKVIITSATIDLERFSEFFDGAPMIEIPGRSYPVEVNYLCTDGKMQGLESDQLDDPISQVVQAVKLAFTRGRGDILIFQSGEKEIREVIEALRDNGVQGAEFIPLFARQAASEQQRVFAPAKQRKIIVATNVAETSLTVPNIRFVIDSGYARINRYNYRTKLQRLLIEPISQASAEQRKGRCGRVGPGICYRLYSADDLALRDPFTPPEILRTHLAGVILKLLALGIKDVEQFPFIDPPDYRHIKDGLLLLERLEAIDEDYQITAIGRLLAQFPIEPKLARVLIAAGQRSALQELLIIASFLSIVDPRERPHEKQEQADLAHAKFVDPDSDFMGFLQLWTFVIEKRAQLSERQFRKCCKENFLSFMRVCEWFDIHEQLATKVKELGFKSNQVAADYASIHQSLLYGFTDTIGTKLEKKEYMGTRASKFMLHPSSALFHKPPSWVMAYEIVYTSKTFARYNAAIDPRWLEAIARPWLKRHYFEPFFDPKTGAVMAFERVTLYGLEIIPKRRIRYEKIDPKKAREIFIMQGLVEGQLDSNAAFYQHNACLITQLKELESRLRRQHVLFQETLLYEFYDERLPITVFSQPSLKQWLQVHDDSMLRLQIATLSDPAQIDDIQQQFPAQWELEGQRFELSYQFDPLLDNDGATLKVPFAALPTIKDADLSWPVPGLMADKIEFYLRALPKRYRIMLSPLPAHIDAASKYMSPKHGSFTQSLLRYLNTHIEQELPSAVWEDQAIPTYLEMHIDLIKDSGVIIHGNNAKKLYQEHKEQLPQMAIAEVVDNKHFTRWKIEEIPTEQTVKRSGFEATYYCALVDHGDSVSLDLFETQALADVAHRKGLARLLLFYLSEPIKQFKRNLSSQHKKILTQRYQGLGTVDKLIDELLLKAADKLWLQDQPLLRNRQAFEQALAQKRAQFLSTANALLQLIDQILEKRQQTQAALQASQKRALAAYASKDISEQLMRLFTSDFIQATPLRWLQRYPIYLKGIEIRLQKLAQTPAKDKEAQLDIDFIQKAYLVKLAKLTDSPSSDDPRITFRWKVEELRVSLFAQALGTIEVVSKVRLLKLLEQFG